MKKQWVALLASSILSAVGVGVFLYRASEFAALPAATAEAARDAGVTRALPITKPAPAGSLALGWPPTRLPAAPANAAEQTAPDPDASPAAAEALTGRILAEETSSLSSGQTLRVRILDVPGMRYPVRREEVLESDGGPNPEAISRLDTAAGHFIARLPAGRTPEQVLAGLPQAAGVVRIEALAPDGTVIVHLAGTDPRSLPDALAASDAAALFDYVEPDPVVGLCATPNDPRYASGELWALRNTGQSGGLDDADIDADTAWDTASSAGSVVVAVIDTGLRFTHEDLAPNLWVNPAEIPANGIDDDANGVVDDIHGYNAITGGGAPLDDHGHGTHCAGTIAASGDNGAGVVGVAWQARLMAVKFLGANGSGFLSDAVRAIDYARLNGAQILSNSWGGGPYTQSLADAIERTRVAGLLFVAAAGNNSSSNDVTGFYPAGYPHENVVSVAATTRTDALASFSNHGHATVDLAAPGASILSCGNASDNAYVVLSGTSMAAPHVSGALALLRAQFPGESTSTLIDRLLASADHPASLAGRVRCQGRLNLASALALTTITPAPSITASPSDHAALLGTPVSFVVSVDGAGPFTYQWRRNGFAIPGATSATFEIAAVAASDEGRYSVLVANATASTLSAEGRLQVGAPPAITAEPADQALPPGAPLSLAVVADGRPFVSYQWIRDGSPLAGAVHPVLDLPSVIAGAYRVEVSNAFGSVSSRVAMVTVPTPPAITSEPAARSVASGGSTTFTASASGSPVLAYQWFKNGASIAGATSASLTRTGLTTADAGSYSLRVTNVAGVAWTAGAALRVTTGGKANKQPAVTSSPADLTVDPGAPITLAPTVTGATPITYVWRKDGVVLSGRTSRILSIAAAAAADSGTYTLVASNSFGAASSRGVRVEVRAAPVIVTPPASQTAAPGARVVLEVSATGTGPLAYSWTRDNVVLPSATSARLVLPALAAPDLGDYAVTVSNSLGSVVSPAATIAHPATTPSATWRQINPASPVRHLEALGSWANDLVVGGMSASLSTLRHDGGWQHAAPMLAQNGRVTRILTSNGVLHAFAVENNTGVLLRSNDGASWTRNPANRLVGSIGQDGAGFFGLTSSTYFARSTDGITWTATATNSPRTLTAIARGTDRFVAVGSGGAILHSTNGAAWTQVPALDASNLTAVCHGDAGFVAAAATGALYHSPDGLVWAAAQSPSAAFIHAIAAGAGRYVAVGGSNFTGVNQSAATYVSTDGLVWRRTPNPARDNLLAVAYLDGRFVAAGGRGTLLVSADGETWTDLAPIERFALRAVAASPTRQVAVGSGYLVYTSDNARDWVSERAPRSDFLRAITHGAGRWLAAADDGNVYTSTGNLADWSPVTVGAGPLTSLNWLADRFLATAENGDLLASSDGLGWSRVASSGGAPLRASAQGDGVIIVVGDEGSVLRSSDGVQWNRPTTETNARLSAVAHGAGRFVALASTGATLTSADGEVWTAGDTGQTQSLASIAYGAGRFVAVGTGGTIVSSEDGLAWTLASPAVTTTSLTRVRFLNGQFVACAGSTVFRSTDGLAWTAHSANLFEDIGWNGSAYLGVGYQRLYSSSNAQSWFFQSFLPFRTTRLNDVIHAAGQFVSVGENGWIETSPDGQAWTTRASGTTAAFYGIAHGSGRFVAVGNGWRSSSADGVTWTAQYAGGSPAPLFFSVVHNGQRFITAGSSGIIHTSEDGLVWTARASGVTSQIESLAVGPGRVVALAFNGEITASSDGLVWAGQTTIPNPMRRVFYLDGRFVVEDINGNRHTSSDGLVWTSAPANDAHGHYDVTELNGVYFGVQENSVIRVLEPADAGAGAGLETSAATNVDGQNTGDTNFPGAAAAGAESTQTGEQDATASPSPRAHPSAGVGLGADTGETDVSESVLAFTLWSWPTDFGHDAPPDLIDYASGHSAYGGATATTITVLPDGRLRLVFLRRTDDPRLRVFAETSSTGDADAADWKPGQDHLIEVDVESLDASTEQVTAETFDAEHPARFIRVRAEFTGTNEP